MYPTFLAHCCKRIGTPLEYPGDGSQLAWGHRVDPCLACPMEMTNWEVLIVHLGPSHSGQISVRSLLLNFDLYVNLYGTFEVSLGDQTEGQTEEGSVEMKRGDVDQGLEERK